MPRVELNKPAPDFTLTDWRGEQFRLSSMLQKKIVIIVFNRGFI